MLNVKKLDERAILPTVAHPGEDLGFDLYALEDTTLFHGKLTKVKTGIAAEYDVRVPVPSKLMPGQFTMQKLPYGLVYFDRSSMASKGIKLSGGVIDAGYRDELVVMLTLHTPGEPYQVKAGDKIAQMIPMPVMTMKGVTQVDELSESSRGKNGFGSSGK